MQTVAHRIVDDPGNAQVDICDETTIDNRQYKAFWSLIGIIPSCDNNSVLVFLLPV